MTFQLESVRTILGEGLPLLEKHWREIAHYQDIVLEPDVAMYEHLEASGSVKAFTARADDGELIGYSVYFIRHNLHYKSSLQAVQDVIYIDPTRRGFGAKFILWCDQQLKGQGVQAVYHHVKAKHDFGPMLERMGYDKVDVIYGKRLD